MAPACPSTADSTLSLLRLYVEATYHQGTGDLTRALQIYEDERFNLDGRLSRPRLDICLLAGLNRLWVLQHPSHRNQRTQTDLLEQIKTICAQYPDREIQTVYHMTLVVIRSSHSAVQQTKAAINSAIKQSQATGNALHSAIALCVLHSFMFEGLVSAQALKSSQAASVQAQRVGNALWMSVADRILSQSYEVHGHGQLATEHRNRSIRYAQESLHDRGVEQEGIKREGSKREGIQQGSIKQEGLE